MLRKMLPSARPRQPRLHGAHRQLQRKGNFFVSQSFHLTQHKGGPLFEGQMLQRRFQPRAELFPAELAVGRRAVGAEHDFAVFPDVLVQGHLICPRLPPPPPLAVPDLVHDNAENPGAQRGLGAEAMEGAEDAEKDFLGNVEGFFAVAKEVRGQTEDQAVVLEHEGGVGGLIAREAAFD